MGMSIAPLKGRDRAEQKMRDDYSDIEPGPPAVWLMDIVRGKIEVDTGEQAVKIVNYLRQHADVVRLKNRCVPPLFTGYRDINLNVCVSGHVCEVQLHFAALVQADKKLQSHTAYEFFRSHFSGNVDAIKDKLGLLLQLGNRATGTQSMHSIVKSLLADKTVSSNMLGDVAKLFQ